VAAGLLVLLLGADTAMAAPAATTGGATNITSGSARLAGSVDPNGQATTYFFEYGTTRRYGSRTPDSSAGKGANPRNVTADVGGLAPNTTYHYRLVASNAGGVVSGEDRTFKTRRQPLGLQIGATPNPVVFGFPTTITGTLTGTGNGGRQLILQQRGFPYTSDFQTVGNPFVTDAAGNFSINLLPPTANTQYRVQTPDGRVRSEPLALGVAVRVQTNVTKTRVRRGTEGAVLRHDHAEAAGRRVRDPARDEAGLLVERRGRRHPRHHDDREQVREARQDPHGRQLPRVRPDRRRQLRLGHREDHQDPVLPLAAEPPAAPLPFAAR
jgi:hypothetical protein